MRKIISPRALTVRAAPSFFFLPAPRPAGSCGRSGRAAAAALMLLAAAFQAPARAGLSAPSDESARETSDSSVLAPDKEPSPKLKDALRQAEAELSKTELGRRLLAETAEVPVVERRRTGLGPVRYVEAPRRMLLADEDRIAALNLFDFELFFLRERRRANARCPAPVFEDDFAAHQDAILYAVEKAETDARFSKRLRAAYRKAEELARSRRFLEEASLKAGGPPLPVWRPPEDSLLLVGAELYLFSEDPYLLYSMLERSLPLSPETVHLSALEDFLALHAGRLQDLGWKAGGRVCVVEGRPYPGALCRAARIVADRDGLGRVREGIGPYDTLLRESLRVRVNRWIRSGE